MRLVLLGSLFLLSTVCAGQEIQWGKVRKTDNRTAYQKVLGIQNGELYVLRSRHPLFSKTKMFVDRYDRETLSHAGETRIELPEIRNADLTIQDVFLLDSGPVAFITARDKGTNVYTAYFKHLGKEDTLIKVDDGVENGFKGQQYYLLAVTPDRSGFAVLRKVPYARYSNEKFSLRFYNGKLQEEWHRSFKLPYEGKAFELSEIIADDEQTIYMISSFKPERSDRDEQIGMNEHNMLVYDHLENKVNEFEIKLGTKRTLALTLQLDQEMNPVIGGFYADGTSEELKGTFYIRIEKDTRKVLSASMKPLNTEDLLQAIPMDRRSGESALSSYYFDHLILHEDGSAIMVAEKYYKRVNSYLDLRTNMITYVSNYYYSEILVVGVDADGTIRWTTIVPKRQYSSNDGGIYSSYALYRGPDKDVTLLYNDNDANHEEGSDRLRFMDRASRSLLIGAHIDSTGGMKTKVIDDNDNAPAYSMPRFYFQPNDLQLIMLGKRGSRFRFGTYRHQ